MMFVNGGTGYAASSVCQHRECPDVEVGRVVDLVGNRVGESWRPTQVDAKELQQGERRARGDDVDAGRGRSREIERVGEVEPISASSAATLV